MAIADRQIRTFGGGAQLRSGPCRITRLRDLTRLQQGQDHPGLGRVRLNGCQGCHAILDHRLIQSAQKRIAKGLGAGLFLTAGKLEIGGATDDQNDHQGGNPPPSTHQSEQTVAADFLGDLIDKTISVGHTQSPLELKAASQ